MNLAIVGAAGCCGRQMAAQLLERGFLPSSARLELVGHREGRSANELWGLRADLEDAFVDNAPAIEVVLEPSAIKADLVVMLAGTNVSTDPNEAVTVDRAVLGQINRQIFVTYADALADRPGPPPVVIVQSNPVELGVQVFAERLGRQRVLGAGAWSDTLRLRAEIAADLKVRRPQVHALMLGQHGDHLIPAWSQLRVRGVDAAEVDALMQRTRSGRTLAELPQEIRDSKARMLNLVRNGKVRDAYELIRSFSPELRAAVKPFFTHFTAGRTTEMATAHAVCEIARSVATGEQMALPAQVALDGEWLDLHGVVGAHVILAPDGWEHVYPLELNSEEIAALRTAVDAIAAANSAIA